MRLYNCPSCGGMLYFMNSACSACNADVAFHPGKDAFVEADEACSNRDEIGCNWARDLADESLCHACRMTDVVPDLSVIPNGALWAEAEVAKRWVLATLARWGWFRAGSPEPLPAFHFKSAQTRDGTKRVMMGHANGVITINVAEADDAIRVRNRQMLDEEYRTMLGHMRHELAHFIFDRLSTEPGFSEQFRALFGDEQADYGAALKRHYAKGPPAGWQEQYVTPYASAHPHEDWAETSAHILHLVDMVDSAVATGLSWPTQYRPPADAYAATDGNELIHVAIDLGMASNQLTRAMGLNDLYPFVLTPAVRDKLEFAQHWLNRAVREPILPASGQRGPDG
ncbi:putative zinc-binding metallopeptidase [Tropicimonas sp. TH_r6]|uniref:zinc-binding metallopeptidase family protein n=1 Tax=Tropicimonas sp. TH_r6 TaxID=3082085 RepID=UPI002955A3DC|nr:putative zinc-binding metallopeptidase [Tropicimonas sp. TH_r6]MDV7142031.1 putative zinc-binding metallopeptidase [Tropicimonas sp. TH_r6]